MEFIIRGDKLKITDAMNDYIEEKLGKLEKYLKNSDDVRVNVIVKVKNHEQRVEITIPLKTYILRSELAKDVKKKGESAKVAIRNIRRDAIDHVKKMGKTDDISEDEVKDLEDSIQKLTDKYVGNVDKAVEAKTKEILTV